MKLNPYKKSIEKVQFGVTNLNIEFIHPDLFSKCKLHEKQNWRLQFKKYTILL